MFNEFFVKHGEKFFYICMIIILYIIAINYCSCSSPTDPLIQYKKSIYELPYDRHYDHDTIFFSDNFIDTSGVIYNVKFTAFNFGDSIKQYPDADPKIEFNYIITIDYHDTLYFSNKLDTEHDTLLYKEINRYFNGRINVHILRYETFKPIDFKCEILYQ